MTSQELRQKYIEFFKAKGHAEIPSASLIPENDPSVLFTTAGMHPLVPFLLGEKHPAGNKLVNFQKCIRTGDIDEVGDQWHLTFFEMLGNWSLGDYGKQEAIKMSFEFLTSPEWLNIPLEKIAVSVFAGDDDAPQDTESFETWKKLGVPEERIYKYGKKENWWGPPGETGPCGPDSEMFYITDKEPCSENCQPSCSCGRYVEIWNDVFMIYNKTADGKYEELKQKNIDTGMGVERVVAVLNNHQDNYSEEGGLKSVVKKIEELIPGKDIKYGEDEELTQSMRIIADHIRASVFILGDENGVEPSNVDQGYVLRKLIRRAIRHGKTFQIKQPFCFEVAKVVIGNMNNVYPELKKNKDFIIEQILKEEEKFNNLFDSARFNSKFKKIVDNNILVMGTIGFDFYQTDGVPPETIKDMVKENGLKISKNFDEEFEQAMQKHQELSRTASAGKFKGGLADHSEQTIKYHTAAHLLLEALRRVLGEHVYQKGSNITEERLRLDFSHAKKMTDEQKVEVEKIVNEQIAKNLPVTTEEMSLEEAKAQNAMGVFENKYGDKVKVYSIGDSSTSSESPFSREICGGPHVKNTGELGKFKIKKEQSSSSGVRRIKAVLE